MSRYASHFNTTETPQTEKIPGSNQVENSAGGYAWAVDDWARLDRFLILGNEGGSYYASEQTLTLENAEAALRCLASDGKRFVERVKEISGGGRAPKNDPAIFLLALAAKKGDDATRKLAYESLPEVCRIGTHLFQFVQTAESFGGWSRGMRRAVGKWYTGKESKALAYQLVKYRQRGGWTHRDALRLSKPSAGTVPALAWAVGKPAPVLPQIVDAFIRVQEAKTDREAIAVLRDCPDLPWEALQSDHLKSPGVWAVLLPRLPLTALIRNLARMTSIGLIGPMSKAATTVAERLSSAEHIRKSRLHPVAILGALCTYQQGHGVRGNLTWEPNQIVMDALDSAFYSAFDNVEPTNKRTLLALDVSGSMGWGTIASMPGLTPRVGAAAMSLITAKTEPDHAIMAFSNEFMPLHISPRNRLDDVVRLTSNLPFQGTDCALPMLWAMKHKAEVDTFVVYTDSETWAGAVHPVQALQKYRKEFGIQAKLVVVGMVSDGFTIADPTDAGMMDVVGFDAAAPQVIADFSR